MGMAESPAAGTAAPPPANCDAWVLNGFRIGMTLEQAKVVRPVAEDADAKNEPGERQFTTLLEDGRTGILIVDAESRVVAWQTDSKIEMATRIRAALGERFGAVNDDHSSESVPWVAWVNPACNGRVVVIEAKILGQVWVSLGSYQRFTASAKKSLGIP